MPISPTEDEAQGMETEDIVSRLDGEPSVRELLLKVLTLLDILEMRLSAIERATYQPPYQQPIYPARDGNTPWITPNVSWRTT